MLKKVSLSSLIALPPVGLPALLAAALTTLAPLTAHAQNLFLTGGSYTANNATYQSGSIYVGMDSGFSTTNSRGIPHVANLTVGSGGAVGTANAYNFSIVTVSGGRVGNVYGYDTSILNISGGTLTNGVFLYDTTATANFVGTDLSFAYQSYGNSNPYKFFADFFKVSGTIGGAPVTYDLYFRNDINSTGTDSGVPTDSGAATENGAAVTVVPEANSLALALPVLGIIGAVVIRRRKAA